MIAKNLLVLFASSLMVKFDFSQCLGREPLIPSGLAGLGYGSPWTGGLGPLGSGLMSLAPANGLASSYGGGMAVNSISPIAPTGLSVNSDNVIEGTLIVAGQLPFLSAVATDGTFTSFGAGTVSYGCGDGAIGITAEGPIAPVPVTTTTAPGYGPAFSGYGNLSGRGGLGKYGGLY